MGVTYKLKDEVVQFIISQRQKNPLFSCRQLAESVAQQFGVRLSKSSVHDVLKGSGITTPRGRKPGPKFHIPAEKKKQIQVSLSQIKLISPIPPVIPSVPPVIPSAAKDLKAPSDSSAASPQPASLAAKRQGGQNDMQISPEYEGAGKIFLKAALWDLGVFSEDNIKEEDWNYYLTYTAGIKVVLENNSSYMIDLPLPLQRIIMEAADCLISNTKPLVIYKVTNEELFRASMEAKPGFKIENISIVDENNHIICEFSNIMEYKRNFLLLNRTFMESKCRNQVERAKALFFTQLIDNNNIMENILNLKGFDSRNKDEYIVTILVDNGYDNQIILQQAVEKLNGMCLRDDQNRLLRVSLQEPKCHCERQPRQRRGSEAIS